MSDTIRTKDELLALFADNITGDISPQDLRDFVVSNQVSENQIESISGQAISVTTDNFYAQVGATEATPPPADDYGNRALIVANSSGETLTINAAVGETVDGGASVSIDDNQFAILSSNDVAAWQQIVNTSEEVDAIHQGDDVSLLNNDAGYLTSTPAPVFGSEYSLLKDTSTRSTSGPTFITAQNSNFGSLPAGLYRIAPMALAEPESTVRTPAIKVVVNGSVALFDNHSIGHEGKDSGIEQRLPLIGYDTYSHGGGPLTVDIEFAVLKGSGASSLVYTSIEVFRIS